MTNNKTVNIPYFQPFEKWLPNETSKAFRIQMKKYFELKNPDYTEEDLDTMIDEIFSIITHYD